MLPETLNKPSEGQLVAIIKHFGLDKLSGMPSKYNDIWITQCTFMLVSQLSLTFFVTCHLSLRCVMLQKGGQVTKSKKIILDMPKSTLYYAGAIKLWST